MSNLPRVLEPATEAELAELLANADADGPAVLPRGGGTKMDWSNPLERAYVILSTKRLDRVLEHAAGDMTVTVEAGCTVAKLQETLAQQGQHLAIDPLWPDRATIGGVLATNDNGPLRRAFGSLRDLIIGVTVALPDGTLARSGGKVVKNVAGYDLPKLMVGALGTLGVITRATFRLHPLPARSRTIGFEVVHECLGSLLRALHDTSPLHAAAQITGAHDAAFETAGVLVTGTEAAVGAKADRVTAALLDAGADAAGAEPDFWHAREKLFEGPAGGVVGRLSILPAKAVEFLGPLSMMRARDAFGWRLVLQACGTGLLRLDAPDPQTLADLVARVRAVAAESSGGSFVVLRRPPELCGKLDAWGDAGDSLPLMRRLKEQFDPRRTLNPGRFVGGI